MLHGEPRVEFILKLAGLPDGHCRAFAVHTLYDSLSAIDLGKSYPEITSSLAGLLILHLYSLPLTVEKYRELQTVAA